MRKSLFAERLRNTLVFAVHTIARLISEFLLGNTPVNGNSPKASGYLYLFLYLVLIFVVSHVYVLHIHVSTIPKMILLMRFILSVVLERTVRFVVTLDVVLEDNNSCLPNNK